MSTRATMIDPERQMLGEVEMVGQDRWEEIHRRAGARSAVRRQLRNGEAVRAAVAGDAVVRGGNAYAVRNTARAAEPD